MLRCSVDYSAVLLRLEQACESPRTFVLMWWLWTGTWGSALPTSVPRKWLPPPPPPLEYFLFAGMPPTWCTLMPWGHFKILRHGPLPRGFIGLGCDECQEFISLPRWCPCGGQVVKTGGTELFSLVHCLQSDVLCVCFKLLFSILFNIFFGPHVLKEFLY